MRRHHDAERQHNQGGWGTAGHPHCPHRAARGGGRLHPWSFRLTFAGSRQRDAGCAHRATPEVRPLPPDCSTRSSVRRASRCHRSAPTPARSQCEWLQVRPPVTETKQHVRPYTRCVTGRTIPQPCAAPGRSCQSQTTRALAGRAGLGDGQPSKCRTCRVGGVWRPLDLPEGATTRQPGGRAARPMWRFRRGLPPGWRVVGRCQVEGTPHDPRCARSVGGRVGLIVWAFYGHKTHPDNRKRPQTISVCSRETRC